MVHSIIAFDNGDKSACASHLSRIQTQLRRVLSVYYDRMHDQKIAMAAWLSHVQGFLAWGAGCIDEETGVFNKDDGLSGNQILLFQAIVAFLGMDSYLSQESLNQNVPRRQREFCESLRKHSIRDQLADMPADDATREVVDGFDQILKRLRVSCREF